MREENGTTEIPLASYRGNISQSVRSYTFGFGKGRLRREDAIGTETGKMYWIILMAKAYKACRRH